MRHDGAQTRLPALLLGSGRGGRINTGDRICAVGFAGRRGHSVGRRDGDTLIVETTDIDWPYLDDQGAPTTPDAVIVERLVLNDVDTVLDPEVSSLHLSVE